MKLKMIAAAVLAALTVPSFAAINTFDDAELVLVVFDSTASYSKDLGIKLTDVVALSGGVAGYSFNIDLTTAGGSAWSTFLGADNALAADTKWAIISTDVDPANGATPGELRLLSTLAPTTVFSNYQNGDWSVSMQQTGAKFGEVNQTGNHSTANYAINGESYNLLGSNAYVPPADTLYSLNFGMSNNVGVSSSLALTQRSNDFDDFVAIDGFKQGNVQGLGVASFNGNMLSYTVAAVPEPGAFAMLLAGMGALGFVGARRRQS